MPASDPHNSRPSGGTRGRGNRERGATLVEMALVLPVFFVFVFGLFEFFYRRAGQRGAARRP